MSKPTLHKVFLHKDGDDFSALRKAEAWLKKNGYSMGSMELDYPIGIHHGDEHYISKWTKMKFEEQQALDGRLESKDFRKSDVNLLLKLKGE